MKHEEVILEKFKLAYARSWEIFQDSCKYTAKKGLNFVKAIVLDSDWEKVKIKTSDGQEIKRGERRKLIEGEIVALTKYLGYNHVIVLEDGRGMGTKLKGGTDWERGIVFVCFLSEAGLNLYNYEQDERKKVLSGQKDYGKDEHGRKKWPSDAFTRHINEIDIYSHEKRGKISGDKMGF